MSSARVYRTIERPSRMFGLETTDAFLWACTFMTLKWSVLFGVVVITISWGFLFWIRYNRPPQFLIYFIRYHLFKQIYKNRFKASVRESRHEPWLMKISPSNKDDYARPT